MIVQITLFSCLCKFIQEHNTHVRQLCDFKYFHCGCKTGIKKGLGFISTINFFIAFFIYISYMTSYNNFLLQEFRFFHDIGFVGKQVSSRKLEDF
jgi:hypothetical protein